MGLAAHCQVQMKKMLSANAEAPYNIECIMEDVDVKVGRVA